MSDVKDYVVGGQFFLEYDSTTLEFVSADPGDPPFTLEIYEDVVETSPVGTIDYAVGVPGGGPGTATPTDMAVLTFTALDEACTAAFLLRFRAHDPPTRLTNEYGDHIGVLANDLGVISIDGTPPVITGPPHLEVSADAGVCDAFVTIPPLVAGDACSGIASIVNDYNGTPDGSDTYPSGTTAVTWTATDNCGNESQAVQNITVNAVNDIVVDIELADVHEPSLTRCITFRVFETGCDLWIVVDQEITFTNGLAVGTFVQVPCGEYECITARDLLHTLTRTDDDGDFGIVGSVYRADFTSSGTTDDSLIGGELKGGRIIDILDFGIFVGCHGTDYGTGDTDCDTPAPHCDISGDGIAFTEDFTFIQVNWLKENDPDCCGLPPLGLWTGPNALSFEHPVTRISVEELKRRGLDDLIVADLNHDGWLDVKDMDAFASGARP
jgi:hypothetical protein